jgi:anaerobic selenocysteine-containing dehydrogenase
LYGLAEKLGLAKYFFSTEEGWWDYILKPAGVTFNQFRQMGTITSTGQYGQVKVEKFDTPSGKVELYSKQLKEWGFDPLPVYYESPETPYSEPELTREYPLIFTTSKSAAYSHSRGRQIEPLRRSHSEPLIRIHPKTATKSGIKDGDWVYIETKRGRIKQKAILSDDIDPRVVMADFGWWFPEKGVQDLYGWAESNINVLTDNKPPHSREMGSTNLRGILCKVYKAEIG